MLDPLVGAYADASDIGPPPREYVGTDVEIGGRVVATARALASSPVRP